MIKSILLVGFLVLGTWHVGAQGREVVIELDSVETSAGQEFDYRLRTFGFDSITSAQFGVTWDSTVIELRSIEFISETGGVTLFSNRSTAGNLRVLFEGTTGDGAGITYPDGTVIAEAKFVAVGRGGQSTTLAPDPEIPLEVIEAASIQRQARIVNGWVHLQPASDIAPEREGLVRVFWPTQRSMNIHATTLTNTDVCVFSADGRLVGCLRVEANGIGEIEFSADQAPGIYYLKSRYAPRVKGLPIQGPQWR